MGSYELLLHLRRHWAHPVNPVYKHDQRLRTPTSFPLVEQLTTTSVRIGAILGVLTLILLALRVMTDQVLMWMLSSFMIQLLCLSGFGLVMLGLTLTTFLWPVLVALTTSGIIVREREKRTLEALLTLPVDWGELLMAKVAASLHWLHRLFEVLLWVQGACVILTFLIGIAQTGRLAEQSSTGLMVILTIIATAHFGIARIQDYTSAAIAGMAASMLSETRQQASLGALFAGSSLLLLRVMFTVICLSLGALEGMPPPQGVIILLATGPTTAILLAFGKYPFVALLILILFPLLREGMIRWAYQWVLRHLGNVTGNG